MTCQACLEPIPPGEQLPLMWEFTTYDLHADIAACTETMIANGKTTTAAKTEDAAQ